MPIVPSTCYRPVQRQLINATEYIWVGEDNVREAFQRFITSYTRFRHGTAHIRHGSAVPGPMEARRRAAKRRMMNLAATGPGVAFEDGGGVGSYGRLSWKDLEWKPPRAEEQPSPRKGRVSREDPVLPRWLAGIIPENRVSPSAISQSILPNIDDSGHRSAEAFDPTVNGTLNPVTTEVSNHGIATVLNSHAGSAKLQREMWERISVKLDACITLEEIFPLIAAYSPHLQTKFWGHRLIQRVLGLTVPLGDVLEFLDTPSLKNLRIYSLGRLLEVFSSKYPSADDLARLEHWIQTRVATGALPFHEIPKLLVRSTHRVIPWTIYPAIWNGLESSNICSTQDLDGDTINRFLAIALRRVEGLSLTIKILPLLHKIRDDQKVINVLSVQLVSSFCDEISEDAKLLSLRLAFLKAIPTTLVSEVILRILSLLVKSVGRKRIPGQGASLISLGVWLDILAQSELFPIARQTEGLMQLWIETEEQLSTLQAETVATYMKLLEEETWLGFLVRNWAKPFIAQLETTPNSVDQAAAFDVAMEKAIEACRQGSKDWIYTSLVAVVTTTYPEILQKLLRHLFPLLRHLKQCDTVLDIIIYLQDQKAFKHIKPNLLRAEIDAYSKTNPLHALNIFLAGPPMLDGEYDKLAEALILTPGIPSGFVFYLLRRHDNLIGVREKDATCLKPSPRRIQLLHTIALHFAQCQHINPREALRGVMRVYQYFWTHRELLNAQMLSALVESGIIRVLDAGRCISPTFVRFVLWLVTHLEGPDVADELDLLIFRWQQQNGAYNYKPKGSFYTCPYPEAQMNSARESEQTQLWRYFLVGRIMREQGVRKAVWRTARERKAQLKINKANYLLRIVSSDRRHLVRFI